MKGKLLILEGGDGVGKSTQALKLREYLGSLGLQPLHIREPGSTPLGEKIRDLLLGVSGPSPTAEAEMLLYMACRAELFRTKISPALAEGKAVILERSYFSTYAYQGGGLGLDGELILRLGDWACGGLEADRVILLDLDPALGLSRLKGEFDRIEARGLDFHAHVRASFKALALRFQNLFCVVDALGDPMEVHKKIVTAIHGLF